MKRLVRFGVSIEENLLKRFDTYIRERDYENRSEAVRDLMRAALVKNEWDEQKDIAGGIAFVYDHHQRQLLNKLLDIQHQFHDLIVSSQHVHLDHDNCLEIVIVKGQAQAAGDLYHRIQSLKGVKYVERLRATIGKSLT